MRARVVLLLLVLSALAATGAVAGVLRVEQDGSGEFVVIQDAVDAAASGDTILIGPGRYEDLVWHTPMNGAAVAYWEDGRDLTFIGSSVDEVTIGPESYVPNGTGPQGIHQHVQDAVVRVENLSFANLQSSVIARYGQLYVSGSRFDVGDIGIGAQDIEHCEVRSCFFSSFRYSVVSFTTLSIRVVDCGFDDAVVSFNDVREGIISSCSVTGGSLVRYSLSRGLVENCTALCDGNVPCISVSDSDTVRFYDNSIRGGNINLSVTGASTNVFLERNDISHPTHPGEANFNFQSNASVFAHNNHINKWSVLIDYVIYTSNYTDSYSRTIDMGSNYWFDDGTPARLDSLIHDGNDDPELHIFVNYDPIRTEPVATEKKSLGGIKALFR